MSDETNDAKDAFEGLVGDIAKLNKESVAGDPPTEILILALEDGRAKGSQTATRNIYEFRARILGEKSPHTGLPMPCFGFVKEVWGDASRASDTQRKNDSNVLEEYPVPPETSKDTDDAIYNQFLADNYPTMFKTTINTGNKKPLLGDIWVATGVDWTNPTKGTATECRYPAHEDSPIMNERIWEPAIAEFFAAVKKGNKIKGNTGTLIEGCTSLMGLFEKELSSLSALPDPPNCHTHPEDPKCSWWMKQHSNGNWYLTPNGRPDGQKRWNYGLTPLINVGDTAVKLREMWTVFREEMDTYVNAYLADHRGEDQQTLGEDAFWFQSENNGVHRVLWEAITPGSSRRTAGSKHGAGLANDMYLHTNILPGDIGEYRGYSSNVILYKNQLLTDAFISFTADWNSGEIVEKVGDQHQVKWGGTFSGGASALGRPARSRGITEFHHWELTNAAIAIAFKGLGTQLAAIDAPTPEEFADADKIEHVLLKLYKKLNDGNNLAGVDEFGEEILTSARGTAFVAEVSPDPGEPEPE